MADKTIARCSFCNRPRNEVKALISANEGGALICNKCVDQSWSALKAAEAKSKEVKEAPLPKPREIKAILDQYVISQETAKQDIAVAVYNHYKRREAMKNPTSNPEHVEIQKSNILLLGPSGTGKTELARSVARMLNVPFYVGDATKLTQAGYVGDDVESLLQGLIQAANQDLERAQWGIIFLDEIDKLARKSGRGATGFRDVTGEGVQQALLKLLEGSDVIVPRGMGMRSGQTDQADVINTSNILFIGAGSFAGIEELIEGRLNKSAGIGFGAADRRKIDKSEIYRSACEDDILDFGLIPEIMGRLPVLTTTLELSEEDMVRILTEPKNALVKQVQALFKMDGIDLQFDPEALIAIGRDAKKRPTGARGLRSIMEKILRPYSYDTPSDSTIKAIRITADVVDGKAEALIVRCEEPAPPEPQQAQG